MKHKISRIAWLLTVLAGLVIVTQRSCAAGLPTGDWIEHGLSLQDKDELCKRFQEGVDGKAIPGGSLMIVHKGEVIFSEAFGLADLETKRPFTTNDLCRLASVTKPHTATVIVMLADQGKLFLDDPVNKYLPEFKGIEVQGQGPPKKMPTIRHCLSHTAGFIGADALKSGSYSLNLDGDLSDVVADIVRQGLVAEPGTRYAYTSLGYFTAGRVAEVISGKPFDTLMREMLLNPIGAGHSTFRPSEEAKKRIPTPYLHVDSRLEPYTDLPRGKVIRPAGGLYSTLDSVARFLLLHRNRGMVDGRSIVSASSLAEMYVPLAGTPGQGYGLGFNVLSKDPNGKARRIQHIGASGTLAWIDFDLDLMIVMLTQVPQNQTQRFKRSVMEKIEEIFTN
ncbi:MAG TPA: serine hydrolase domain-containing protein [Sedimentisphaerales bacterium]|nr:serine hydrolase domain-containing protein [Sedimentisphaerales bacterium]